MKLYTCLICGEDYAGSCCYFHIDPVRHILNRLVDFVVNDRKILRRLETSIEQLRKEAQNMTAAERQAVIDGVNTLAGLITAEDGVIAQAITQLQGADPDIDAVVAKLQGVQQDVQSQTTTLTNSLTTTAAAAAVGTGAEGTHPASDTSPTSVVPGQPTR